MIDVIGLLDSLEIDYKLSGKNVSRGWVEIHCPMDTCSDPGFHMGINLSTSMYHCWICGQKGSMYWLLVKGFSIPANKAKEILIEFDDETLAIKSPQIHADVSSNILPKETIDILPELHRRYLLKRNFNPDIIQKKYQIKACNTIGDYAYRIIIPVVEDGIVVNFTARDVTNKQEVRYQSCPNHLAISSIKDCVYNIDSVNPGDDIIICEGAFDVWRMGNKAIATFGTEVTTAQIALLNRKSPKRVFLLFDNTAISKAKKVASALVAVCFSVEILSIDKKDPAELNDEEALAIRKELKI